MVDHISQTHLHQMCISMRSDQQNVRESDVFHINPLCIRISQIIHAAPPPPFQLIWVGIIMKTKEVKELDDSKVFVSVGH